MALRGSVLVPSALGSLKGALGGVSEAPRSLGVVNAAWRVRPVRGGHGELDSLGDLDFSCPHAQSWALPPHLSRY